MKKKLIVTLIALPLLVLIWGLGKLYIAYNLTCYSGYYVQHMPRKEGTNPELAILIDNVHFIDKPRESNIDYDLDGNGSITRYNEKDIGIYITKFEIDSTSKYILDDFIKNKSYTFSDTGEFRYYYTYIGELQEGEEYEKEAQKYLDEILPVVLKGQRKPLINLQGLFNEKYQERFD